MSVQLYIHVILGIHVFIAYWITPFKMRDGEPVPHERMKVSPKVNQKLVMDLPNGPCGAHYVVGSGAYFIACLKKLATFGKDCSMITFFNLLLR